MRDKILNTIQNKTVQHGLWGILTAVIAGIILWFLPNEEVALLEKIEQRGKYQEEILKKLPSTEGLKKLEESNADMQKKVDDLEKSIKDSKTENKELLEHLEQVKSVQQGLEGKIENYEKELHKRESIDGKDDKIKKYKNNSSIKRSDDSVTNEKRPKTTETTNNIKLEPDYENH